MSLQRSLGRNGPKVGAIGMGCWAIGGHFTLDSHPAAMLVAERETA